MIVNRPKLHKLALLGLSLLLLTQCMHRYQHPAATNEKIISDVRQCMYEAHLQDQWRNDSFVDDCMKTRFGYVINKKSAQSIGWWTVDRADFIKYDSERAGTQ